MNLTGTVMTPPLNMKLAPCPLPSPERVLLGLKPLTPTGGKNLCEATTAYPLRVQPSG